MKIKIPDTAENQTQVTSLEGRTATDYTIGADHINNYNAKTAFSYGFMNIKYITFVSYYIIGIFCRLPIKLQKETKFII